MKHKPGFPKWSQRLCAVCFWIALWWIVAAIFAKPLLLPTPPATLRALWRLAGDGSFYLTLLTSLTRILVGIVLLFLVKRIYALEGAKTAPEKDAPASEDPENEPEKSE